MTPQEHDVAQVMLALRCTTGVAAKDVDDCHPAVRDMAYTQARHALADPRPLLDALLGTVDRDQLAAMAAEEKALEVAQTSDPYGFIVGGITVHNFRQDPDFSDDPRREWLWGYYLVGSDWVGGFATMMDAARAGRRAVLHPDKPADEARCDVCDEPCDDLHAAVVDGENLDVCWKCCPDCPTKEAS